MNSHYIEELSNSSDDETRVAQFSAKRAKNSKLQSSQIDLNEPKKFDTTLEKPIGTETVGKLEIVYTKKECKILNY